MPVKISSLELENVKRIKAVSLEPTADGLTVIGGRNSQGKTSVIDAIAWALGGEKFRPAAPNRKGSTTPAKLTVELSNGLVVTRSGTNGSLKVLDPTGKKSGQTLLNSFIDVLAIDLPKFMSSTDKEKAEVLLDLLGLKDEVVELDRKLNSLMEQRKPLKTDYLGKRKVANDMPFYEDAPAEPVTATELIQQQQEILARNGENQRKRSQVDQMAQKLSLMWQSIESVQHEIQQLQNRLSEAQEKEQELTAERLNLQVEYKTAQKSAEELKDESTAEIESSLAAIDETNRKVRENQKRADLYAEAEAVKDTYDQYTKDIEDVRKQRLALLNGAKMPLDGLDIQDGSLIYKGAVWSDMSSAEQLRVATAIVRALKPECGFVLIDKLEQMDTNTLAEFGEWAAEQGLQVIGTRVSTGDECSVIIEDGRVASEQSTDDAATTDTPTPVLDDTDDDFDVPDDLDIPDFDEE